MNAPLAHQKPRAADNVIELEKVRVTFGDSKHAV
ncbi:MAG: Nitrate transporter ATP-binding protein, partial [Tardiphaga sp.]|nr:Nitrate transporter ATP-binding protein [Tardiphaga sp.]